ncbi:polysaccharide deacetylase [Bifidobacterium tissieri]|uniref:Polysaccharide deacetylase n=1 Tax=Bifidobacterium tissieri TaxID=1630162 RepID=A0A261FE57_9BIFI|nr:polysaccharide deacetylase family protein [Bifidobacterium tissieri]OZG57378.1 polysaccharide deacetylase [Bifidobacterium tissieri]
MASPNDRMNDDDMAGRGLHDDSTTRHQTPEHVEELHFGDSARGAYYDDDGKPRKRGFFWRFSRAAKAENADEAKTRRESGAAGTAAGTTSVANTVESQPRPEHESRTQTPTEPPHQEPAIGRIAMSEPEPEPASTPARTPVIPTTLTVSGQSGDGTATANHGWTVARKCVTIIMTMVVVAAAGCTSFWMWENRLRPITVTVNGTSVKTRVNTSLITLLNINDGFGTQAGKLLSVSGKTLDEHGGDRYAVTLGNTEVKSSDLASTRVNDGDVLFVKNGKDTTEPHQVVRAAIPFGNDVNLKGGGTIQYVEQQGVDGVKEQWVGEQSKETVDKKVLKEPVNFKVTTKSPNPQDGKKYIALTFDDGPSKYTQDILNILNEKGVHATFFNLSEQGTEFPDQEKAVAAAGNEVASHSVSHKYLPKLSRDDLRKEINDSFAPIEANTGGSGRMFRSPYGAFEAQQWVDSTDLISMNVLWSIDTEDWRRPGPDKIHDAVLGHARNGSIVLMHDGGGDRSQDIEALPRIIDDLKNEGFTFVTVSEMIKLDGTFPQHVMDNQPVPAVANASKDSAASGSADASSSPTTK